MRAALPNATPFLAVEMWPADSCLVGGLVLRVLFSAILYRRAIHRHHPMRAIFINADGGPGTHRIGPAAPNKPRRLEAGRGLFLRPLSQLEVGGHAEPTLALELSGSLPKRADTR